MLKPFCFVPKEFAMVNVGTRQGRKPWKKPELVQLAAGSAELTTNGNPDDGGAPGSKKS